jgi:hypothetical protein
MNNVIAFPGSLLEPFLGTWIRDPLSVSRNKVVKHRLGQDGLKLLWGCGSMAQIQECLSKDGELAAKYESLSGSSSQAQLIITRHQLTWINKETAFRPGQTRSSPVLCVLTEGRKTFVQTVPSRTVCGYDLRKKNEWLLVSERYSGRNALLFPASPVFRYYRAD